MGQRAGTAGVRRQGRVLLSTRTFDRDRARRLHHTAGWCCRTVRSTRRSPATSSCGRPTSRAERHGKARSSTARDAAETRPPSGSSQSVATASTQLVFELDPNAIDRAARSSGCARAASLSIARWATLSRSAIACHSSATTARRPAASAARALADTGDGAASSSTPYTYVGAFRHAGINRLTNELGSNAAYAYATRRPRTATARRGGRERSRHDVVGVPDGVVADRGPPRRHQLRAGR